MLWIKLMELWIISNVLLNGVIGQNCFETNNSEVVLYVGEIEKIDFICKCCVYLENITMINSNFSQFDIKNNIIALRILSEQKKFVIPLENQYSSPRYLNQKSERPIFQKCPFYSDCLVLYYKLPTPLSTIYLDANKIGKTTLHLSIISWNISELPSNNIKFYLDDQSFKKHSNFQKYLIDQSYQQQVISSLSIPIVVLRKNNICNGIFDLSSAFIASLLSLSIGCNLKLNSATWNYFKRPCALQLALFVQYIVLPAASLAIYKMLGLPKAIGYGLFALGATPGGGIAHIIVFLMKGDEHLSSLLSSINSFFNAILTLSLMYLSQSLFDIDQLRPLYLGIWLGIIPMVQSTGVLINHLNEELAQAIQTWFTRPLLLLAGILFVTLGVYINNYAFNHINQRMILGVLILMLLGFILGTAIDYSIQSLHRKHHITPPSNPSSPGGPSKPSPKHHHINYCLSVELALSNSLIMIPALRYSLPQPLADISSTVCLWNIFLSPLALIWIYTVNKSQRLITNLIQRNTSPHHHQHHQVMSSSHHQQSHQLIATGKSDSSSHPGKQANNTTDDDDDDEDEPNNGDYF